MGFRTIAMNCGSTKEELAKQLGAHASTPPLRHNGQLIVVEGEDPLQVNGHDVSWWRNEIKGWYSGVARAGEDALNFAVMQNIRPVIEKHPFEEAEQAYTNINKAHMRSVLVL
jgi:D-arabinose 1-dehydrogenase-like Zn-dependent alcohol dehydrogenase